MTRQAIIDLCRRLDIRCVEKTLQRHDLYIADECLVSGTGAEICPVTKIDGRVIGTGEPGPITKRLMEAYKRLVREGE